MKNEVLDCIRARRSTRSFEARQIEPEALDALLEAAVWAPSGGDNQSWLFTAVQTYLRTRDAGAFATDLEQAVARRGGLPPR